MRKICIIVALLFLFQCTALATGGDPNIDGGGGGMGSGASDSFWSAGWDGVRVSIIRNEDQAVMKTPIDLSNKSIPSSYLHFGKVSKIKYRAGASLSLKSGGYSAGTPETPLPPIVDSASYPADIERTRAYFTDEDVVRAIATKSGMSYDVLICGDYKLLIEPIAYFTLDGQKYAMTATEVALYDQLTGGSVRSKLVSMSHKNLPLAPFLSKPTLGFQPWTGSKSTAASNASIIASLGVGAVSFAGDDDLAGGVVTGIETGEYVYRADTDVITSVYVTAESDITPDNPASVTFKIKSSTYTVNNIVCPAGDSQVVWVKWRTPSTAQQFDIEVSATGGAASSTTLPVRVVLMEENEPPDPTIKDFNPCKGPYPTWKKPDVPTTPSVTLASQGAVTATWQSNIQWVPNIVTEQQPVWNPTAKWVQEKKWVTYYVSENRLVATTYPGNLPSPPTSNDKYEKAGYNAFLSVYNDLLNSINSGTLTSLSQVRESEKRFSVEGNTVDHGFSIYTQVVNRGDYKSVYLSDSGILGNQFFLVFEVRQTTVMVPYQTLVDDSRWVGAWSLQSVTVDRGEYKDLGKYVYQKNLYTQQMADKASWGIWSALWHPNWVWVPQIEWEGNETDGYTEVDNGSWEDKGWWDYTFTSYSAQLSATLTILPDELCPTADRVTNTMKSGYGMTVECTTEVSTNAPNSHVTAAQNALSYYPDFMYKDYWRVSKKSISGLETAFMLGANWYSHYDSPVHFTPIWWPDGEDYTIVQEVIDCWTPAGMLSLRRDNYVMIDGGSVLDDWHVGPLPVIGD